MKYFISMMVGCIIALAALSVTGCVERDVYYTNTRYPAYAPTDVYYSDVGPNEYRRHHRYRSVSTVTQTPPPPSRTYYHRPMRQESVQREAITQTPPAPQQEAVTQTPPAPPEEISNAPSDNTATVVGTPPPPPGG